MGAWLAWLLAVAATAAAPATAAPLRPGQRIVIDDFEGTLLWSPHPASGVDLSLHSDAGVHGRAMRIDFGFTGGGYAVARREVSIDLPENYRLRFAVRGKCLPNDLELKLIDSTGANVWWCNRRSFVFPEKWDSLSTKKRQIEFAWGPVGGGDLRHVAAIEIAVTAGQGGRGSVWLDDFTLEALAPPDSAPPAPRATASSGNAALAVDRDSATAWTPAVSDARPWITVDLGVEREFGGLIVEWAFDQRAPTYAVDTSVDGESWRVVREVHDGKGARDFLQLPESEARWVRLRSLAPSSSRKLGLAEITLQPLAFGATPESFFQAIARRAPRGTYPRGILGEPTSWAVVGVDADSAEGLFGKDGAIETGKAQFSVEPFLWYQGRLVTWADVTTTLALVEPGLPIPSATWHAGALDMTITPIAHGAPGRSSLWVRYRFVNRAARAAPATLYLAIRPFQVNPPSQTLNTAGGTAVVSQIIRIERDIRVNDDRRVFSLATPDAFGAATLDQGDIVDDYLRHDRLPGAQAVQDPQGRAAAALEYRLVLEPGKPRDVIVVIPLHGLGEEDEDQLDEVSASPRFVRYLERAEKDARASWSRVSIDLPKIASEAERTLIAQLAWIQINRDGPAIQPGSRSYERSWIRDGSLTSSALLRLGHPEMVREFMEWYARYQYADGKVPCCVDRRGGDPVPEHDSHGEFIYLVAEYYRYTGDRPTVERLWPKVAKAVNYLDSLRRERRGEEWRTADKKEFYGLLPPSISHEGYSAKPMHSYWDDFFALRGFKDAVFLATELGRDSARVRLATSRDEFERDLAASIPAAMARHSIDYVPGCADQGDFDATSTTVALEPAAAEALLPKGALERTFERYWEFFRDRRDGKTPWEAFTPYEIRTIGAFVRLGWRERAGELLPFFLDHRLPPEWAQWPEVVWHDTTTAHFIGDLPHTWVGSDYVRSVLDMLAYEREADSSLVLGAGIPRAWIFGAEGVAVKDLRTTYGKLSYRMRAEGDSVVVRIETGLRMPKGGIVVSPPPPGGRAYRRVTLEGQAARDDSTGVTVVRSLPAVVRFE